MLYYIFVIQQKILFLYELSKDLFDSNLETSRLTHNSATLAADHSYLQTCILTFPATPRFSPTRLSGERLSVIRRGLGGQIAIYSLPVGEVCVSRL